MYLYTVSLMICYGYCKALGSLNPYYRMQRQLLPLQWIDFPSFRTMLNYSLQTLCLQKNSRSCFFLGMCETCFLVIVIFNADMYQSTVLINTLYISAHKDYKSIHSSAWITQMKIFFCRMDPV